MQRLFSMFPLGSAGIALILLRLSAAGMLLTSQASEALRTVDTVIIDEIHALVPTKRGAHLALSLERLEALTKRRLQRIGLSATQNPLEEIGRYLVGPHREVTIIDVGARIRHGSPLS